MAEVCVSGAGMVEKMRVLSGPAVVREAFVDAVSKWVFKPYRMDEKAVPVSTTVTIPY